MVMKMKIKVMLIGYVDAVHLEGITQEEIQDTINGLYEGDIGIYDLIDEYKVYSVGLEQDTE